MTKKNGEIRTHNYHDHSRVFALVSSVLTTKDLLENREVTYKTYKRLRLLGNDFSRMVSRAFTISDILLPIIRDKKRGVIVPVGLEEHHHPFLARTVRTRRVHGVQLISIHWLNKEGVLKLKKKVEL